MFYSFSGYCYLLSSLFLFLLPYDGILLGQIFMILEGSRSEEKTDNA